MQISPSIWHSNPLVRKLSTSAVAEEGFIPLRKLNYVGFSTLYVCQPSQQRLARDILV